MGFFLCQLVNYDLSCTTGGLSLQMVYTIITPTVVCFACLRITDMSCQYSLWSKHTWQCKRYIYRVGWGLSPPLVFMRYVARDPPHLFLENFDKTGGDIRESCVTDLRPTTPLERYVIAWTAQMLSPLYSILTCYISLAATTSGFTWTRKRC